MPFRQPRSRNGTQALRSQPRYSPIAAGVSNIGRRGEIGRVKTNSVLGSFKWFCPSLGRVDVQGGVLKLPDELERLQRALNAPAIMLPTFTFQLPFPIPQTHAQLLSKALKLNRKLPPRERGTPISPECKRRKLRRYYNASKEAATQIQPVLTDAHRTVQYALAYKSLILYFIFAPLWSPIFIQ